MSEPQPANASAVRGTFSGSQLPTAGAKRRVLRLWTVDDNAGLREAFAQLLNRGQELKVTQQFSSTQALLAALAEQRPPDIILLDLNLGKENGLSAIRPIKKLAPSVKVLMLTTFNDSYSEVDAFRLGASGFLLKIYELEEIVNLIHQAYYHPDDARLFPNLAQNAHPPAAMEAITDSIPGKRAGFVTALKQFCRPPWRHAAH